MSVAGRNTTSFAGNAKGAAKFQDYDTYLPVCKDMMLQLATMIQEVLDASKLSGQQEEKVAEVSLSELLNEVCSPYILIAKAKGINFKMDVDDSSYAMLPQKAVTKAISNIISNICFICGCRD